MFKQPRSVLVLIYTTTGEVLLLKRTGVRPFWQSVTGSVHPGESLSQTARREVQEETGIDVTESELDDWRIDFRYSIFPEYRYRYPPGTTRNLEHLFALRLPAARPIRIAPAEHSEYCWMDAVAARDRVLSWSNSAAIDLLLHPNNATP